MGAKLPHIVKYINAYNDLYPEAAKIIVRSEPSSFWSSAKARRAYLAPVVEALELLGCLPPAVTPISQSLCAAFIDPIVPYPSPSVLVHTFSNGGAWQLTALSEILSERTTSQYYTTRTDSLPASAVILDSSPGDGGPDRTVRAFTSAIGNPALRLVVKFCIRSLFALASETMMGRVKTRLHASQLLPWLGPRTRRLYLYSDADDMIPAEEVEAHAAEAKGRGLEVRMEKFEGSPHVAHARTYPERYWGAVRKVWEDACKDAGDI
ncbi:hypothetical protein BJ912DRAFT_901834 [Pholiota molesta]|nr:hypothetical protein BJ912DRAFT_901834 [Pholiota molesta]